MRNATEQMAVFRHTGDGREEGGRCGRHTSDGREERGQCGRELPCAEGNLGNREVKLRIRTLDPDSVFRKNLI